MAKVHLVSLYSLSLSTDRGEVYDTLAWSVRNGYPRLVAYVDKPSSPIDDSVTGPKPFDYDTMLTAPFSYVGMNVVTDTIKKVAFAKKPGEWSFECMNTKFVDGKRTDEVYLQATVIIGKDEDGIIYIKIVTDKKSARFDILPNTKWHKYHNNDGLITDKGELSKIYAVAYADQAKRLLNNLAEKDTVKEHTVKNAPDTQLSL